MVDKKEFIDFLIESDVLRFGDFVTKSGRKTSYFVNTGNFTTGEQMARLGEYYSDCIMDNIEKGKLPRDIDAIFGPAYKGIPLVVAIVMAMKAKYGLNWEYCFNRKEEKDHGEGGSIVGYQPKDKDKILIIEDVITAGTSVREVVPLLYATADVEISGLVIAVDRMEQGRTSLSATEEIMKELGIPTFSIVNIKEILDVHPQ